MSIDFTKLEADVAAEAQVEVAAAQLLAALTAEIKLISSQSTDAATQAKLDALAADTETRTAALAAAVAANPAAPPPTPAP